MKVRSRSVSCEARQWFPAVTIEGVTNVPVLIEYNDDGSRYCVRGLGVTTTAWAEVHGNLKFAFEFWDVTPGEKMPVDTTDPLYIKFAQTENWKDEAQPYGVINPPHGFRAIIKAGDWVVTEEGKLVCYTPEAFKTKYEFIQ